MSLAPGARLGPYEILAPLGAGGMGEVYRAHDAKLHRDVALKVLPDLFALDADRLARFTREAHVLASLNHPHIAAIYGIEESDGAGGSSTTGVRALVLELVDGPTLADRIAQGPIPLDEALPIARQIIEALEAAHELGIVHRDLKPANIKVKDDGTVKVLDFGLAKALAADAVSAAASDVSHSPTITSPAATRLGVILGTAAYMAPEQARGKPVERRADIWAFGCVVYEMLTGRRAFQGEDMSDTLAAVLRAEVDWSALPTTVPARLRQLLQACVQKDPKQRVQAVGDVRLALDRVLDVELTTAGSAVVVQPAARSRTLLLILGGVLLGSAITSLAAWMLSRAAPQSQAVTRFPIPLAAGQNFTAPGRHLVAVSPQGTHLVYVASNGLWLRPVGELQATLIRGTEGGRSPFFSTDGQWIGFWASGQLKRVSVAGGAPMVLGAASNPFGVSWGADDTIFFGQGAQGIWRVSASGGTSERLLAVDAGEMAHGPQLLPGGDWLLYTLRPSGATSWDQAQIVVQSLATRERSVLIAGGRDARYLPTGHLVYARDRAVLAVPFDVAARRVTGVPVSLVEDVADAGTVTGAAHFSIASAGSLVYVPGDLAAGQRTLVWVDRTGREEPLGSPTRAYLHPRLSPDGTRVALDINDQQSDIWIWDLSRRTLTRLTTDPANDGGPVWSPDGKRVAFSSRRDGSANLYWQAADGSGTVERLIESSNQEFLTSFSPDGKHAVFDRPSSTQSRDLGVIAVDSDRRRAELLLSTPFNEENGEISPDGRWLAYQSNESGQDEIYVRPFPDVQAGRWQISTGGGTRPLWARHGRELYYLTGAGVVRLMAVSVQQPGASFVAGSPQMLFEGPYYTGTAGRVYDVSADGKRFLMARSVRLEDAAQGPAQLVVVQNWIEELKRLVPAN